eukprot:9040106-Pyramimonas_sp.AAC.1
MGDPFAVKAFVGTFARPVLQWQYDQQGADPQSRLLHASWESLRADLSLYKYADDINKIIIANSD